MSLVGEEFPEEVCAITAVSFCTVQCIKIRGKQHFGYSSS